MKKIYSIYMVLLLLGSTIPLYASSITYNTSQKTMASETGDNEIEGFRMYPNPVRNGVVTILTKKNLTKDIVIFDVLGKEVLKTTISNNTLSVSSLTTGVYILKVTEDGKTSTRKLVIR